MALGDPNPASLLKSAQKLIAQRRAAMSAPVAVWAGLDEAPAVFAKRVRNLGATHTGKILAAVPHGYVKVAPRGSTLVEFPEKLFRLLHPSAASRYRCASGGRGSGKSHSFARAVILRLLSSRMRVLCCREIMRSLRESVHHLLVDTVDRLELTPYFEVNDREITCTITGGEIIFAGLWANVDTLKSLENISLVWVEESESVSDKSLQVLTPTVRAPNSEIWFSCNPDAKDAPVMEFANGERPCTRHEHVIFSDNPFFPSSLEEDRQWLQKVDDDAYRHVWLGECRTISDAQIFRNKYIVEEFTPGKDFDGPYFGLDLGFSSDPSVLTKCWVHDAKLYIQREAWRLHCDIDKLPQLLDEVPEARNATMRVDSSRPETVSYLKQHGFTNAESVSKWPDSILDGIARMRAFEKIVVHPSCTHVIEEMRLYSYKVDRLTGDVLPIVLDKFNHCIDSIRYAIAPLIKTGGAPEFLKFLGVQRTPQSDAKQKLTKLPGITVRDIDLFGHRS